MKVVDRIVQCPDCYRYCSWCSWYAKNARDAGCGTAMRKGGKRCEWEALKGTSCPTCHGTERVRLVGQLQPIDAKEPTT